jgi:hypothetical protein
MNDITKVLLGIVGVAMVTALVLPNRGTAAIIKVAGDFFNGALSTAIEG